MKRATVAAVLLCALLEQGTMPAGAQAPDSLKFFKNHFVTGDYVVAGVGLRGRGVNGLATGTISISGVPAGADILAAYLYWQVVSTTTLGPESGSTGVTFDGKPISALVPDADGRLVERPSAKLLGSGSPPCWSSGGSTGSSGGVRATYSYRVDVLRYFDIDEITGEPIVNGPHLVTAPDSGSSGNGVPIALGASLVVVYRDATLPLRAIVLYDGGYTLDNSTRAMRQTIKGFYQSATGTGKLTHIVGSGQPNKAEVLTFNGALLADSPFGAYAGPSWDNPTFEVAFPAASTQVTTVVDPSADCLTWGATVFRTEVTDTDRDGLVDVWETSSDLVDPDGQPLPDLRAMGADPLVKDLFLEIGYLKADGDPVDRVVSYGGVRKPAHSHLPKPEAIKLIGDAFKNAPVDADGSGGFKGIRLHVDAGPDYPYGVADEYVVRGRDAAGEALARGGEFLDETAQQCNRLPGDPPWRCQFSAYPGTVGWKTGFRFYRDQVVGGQPAPAADEDDPCDAPGNDGPGQPCERRFDRNRRHMFRYALFAHAIGLPKSELPCLDDQGHPEPDVNGACPVRENPDFRTPRTITGVGDFPGSDVVVALGAFADVDGVVIDHDGDPQTTAEWTPLPTGTTFMQASTLMHELGHNLERRHGGDPLEPNCKPTYLSVMNYLYQLRGLLDDFGRPNLDFSRSIDPTIDERTLSDGFLAPLSVPYRIGWYAPLAGSYLAGRGTPAARHCDGSGLLRDEDGNLTEPSMVRIDARTAAGPIDWKANGIPDPPGPEGPAPATFALDVNFGGSIGPLSGSDDWASVRLDQIGARRTVGALFLDRQGRRFMGPLSIDGGRSDYGRSDYGRSDYGRSDYGRSDYGGEAGRSDYGRSDYGRSDYGRSDYGRSDYGRSDYGRGDDGRGDFGGGDLFLGDPVNPGGELDFETAVDLAKTPPNEFRACVIGADPDCACPDGSTCVLNQVRSDFKASNIGGVQSYDAYCVAGATVVPDTPDTPWVPVGRTDAVPGQIDYFVVGDSRLARGTYTCFATAAYQDTVSDPSNLQTIEAVNSPPVAGELSVVTDEDVAVAITLTGSDVDGDPLSFAVVSPPAYGTLTGTGPHLTYTPAANHTGSDEFTYRVNDGQADSGPATVSISVRPVNDPPVAGALSVRTDEDTSVAIDLSATDVDGDLLTYTIVSSPAHGALTGAAPLLTYTPAPDYYGADSFTYRASDGEFSSAPATVAIAVAPVNDSPVASADAYSVLQGSVLTVATPGVLTNDADIDPDTVLTAVLVSGPSKGTLVLNADGSFTYTPSAGFSGPDAFTYQASDGAASANLSNAAEVSISVTAAYTFFGLQNAPPAAISPAKAGSSVPMKWQYRSGTTAVSSAQVGQSVTVVGPLSGPVATRTFTNTDSGGSSFRYDAAGETWYFNLQTKGADGKPYPAGDYDVTITPLASGYTPSPTFRLVLVK